MRAVSEGLTNLLGFMYAQRRYAAILLFDESEELVVPSATEPNENWQRSAVQRLTRLEWRSMYPIRRSSQR